MPNKKLSEYQIKKLYSKFFSIPFYGDYINSSKKITNENLKDQVLVAKIDNGTKGRFKNGLVKLNSSSEQIYDWVNSLNSNENFYVEKFESVTKEYYMCIRAEDDYDVIYINDQGGVDNMNPLEGATKIKIKVDSDDFHNDFKINELPIELCISIEKLYNFFKHFHFTFLEVNPLALTETGEYKPIDFAVFIDESSLYLFPEYDNILNLEYSKIAFNHPTEEFISKLDAKTGSSLKFTMLNENGSIWTLISGGGASVLFTDAIVNRGYGSELANYGEMSGDPPSEYVYLYVSEVLSCMKKVEGEKVLFIGGAIANFTDVYESFKGIVKAFSENLSLFSSTKVFVRRGGPKSKEALEHLQEFSDKHKLNFKIYNTTKGVTEIVRDALEDKTEKELENQFENLNYSHLYNQETQVSSPGILNISQFMIYSYNPKAIQRMLDYDYISNKKEPSIACIVDVRKSKDSFEKFFWGEETILLPLYSKVDETILSKHKQINSVVSFASHRSAYISSLDILNLEAITSLTIIAEGIPERYARLLQLKAQEKNKTIIGPATVGGIKPGSYRIGNTCGTIENISNLKLHRPGCVGFVSRSGGMLNEMCNIINGCTNGVYQAISIGGDRYPSSSFMHHILNYQNDNNIKVIVMLGEIGGHQEILVANAVKSGAITKPIIAWCMGTSNEFFGGNVQFGHAGASANSEFESAIFKNMYMKESGILVPDTFEGLESILKTTYYSILEGVKTIDYTPPKTLNEASRTMVQFFSSISDETGPELLYNGVKVSEIKGVGDSIGHLWFKKDLPEWMSKYIELIITCTADHGAMVSGAHNTIVSSRAGKDLVSSLCSGLLTIGDYFGGAINESGCLFYKAYKTHSPKDFVKRMNKENKLISGIGHKIKTKQNPDSRITVLHNYLLDNFEGHMEILDYAFKVEEITLSKRNNLILNVDGFIACSILDCLLYLQFTEEEIDCILTNGMLNSFFVLSRTIGFIGHFFDQKRLKQGLFRLDKKDISYV